MVSFVDAAFGGLALARRLRLPARPGGRLHRRGGGRQPDVLQGRGVDLDPPPGLARPLPVRGRGHARADPGHLRPGPQRAEPQRTGRGRRLHRRGLLLHQLDQLRQPGHHRRAHVLQHLRRHRPVVGPELHRRPDRRRSRSPSASSRRSIPASPRPRRPTSSSPIIRATPPTRVAYGHRCVASSAAGIADA